MWSKNTSFINGELALSGIPASQLAAEFGTPTFFLDEDAFRTRAASWRDGLAVGQNEAPHPIDIHPLGAQTVVFDPDPAANFVQQARTRRHSSFRAYH